MTNLFKENCMNIGNTFKLCIALSCIIVISLHTYERRMIIEMSSFLNLSEKTTNDLLSMVNDGDQKLNTHFFYANQPVPLFTQFPFLRKEISYIQLGDLPTPIHKMSTLATLYNVPHLYIKRDDLTGQQLDNGERLFGGNKVRKLEFLLADALAYRAPSIITFGCAGSNHATATALYAQRLGLPCILMLKPQPNSYTVRRNLLLDLYSNAEMVYSPTNSLRAAAATFALTQEKLLYGKFPYAFPTGGSNSRGALGYVNAAFELKEQILAGQMPEPTRIYMAINSAGTMGGLLLGIKAAGITTKVYGITVEPADEPNEFLNSVKKIFATTNKLLRDADPAFPLCTLEENDFTIIEDFCGTQYALFTPEATAAMQDMTIYEDITLDGVYTGKACACLLRDLQQGIIDEHEVVLFWNTYYGDTAEELINNLNYAELPQQFHKYFETDVQPLDF